MPFRIVLLVAVMLGPLNVKSYKLCEYAHLIKCNEVFVAGFRVHPNDPDIRVYCDAYQVSERPILYPVKLKLNRTQTHLLDKHKQ